MSTRKSVTLLVAGSLLLTLASCGGKDSSSSPKQNQVTGLDGLTSVNWKIQLQGKSFPDEARIDINGTTVLNSCVPKQKYEINYNSEPQHLYLENYLVPSNEEVEVTVADLGNCDSDNE